VSRGYARADVADYQKLPLHAHELLADVPLHDVWRVELVGGPPDCKVEHVRPYLSYEALTQLNAVVRGLFALRGFLGRVFRLDSPDPVPNDGRERDGPFEIIHRGDSEAIGEIVNKTVHAFSVMALEKCEGGHRFYWGIYVRPVGRITSLYMALIDPFRHYLVYPAILGHLHRSWKADHAGQS
jgi:hypothetical protein